MLNYHFNKKLVSTDEILRELDLPVSTLNFWKTQWRQNKFKNQTSTNCYDMGLRLIGNKAYWDPVQFVNWVAQFKLTNKPTTPDQELDQQKLIAFVSRNVEIKKEIRTNENSSKYP